MESVTLTRRQVQILELVSQGNTEREIAEELCLSPKTIKWHKHILLQNLGAKTSAHAVAIAYENRFLYMEWTTWTHCGIAHSFPHCPTCGIHRNRVPGAEVSRRLP